MFIKLFKYDFRSTWGLLSLLSLIALGASALGTLFLRQMGYTESPGLLVFGFLVVVFYLIAYSLASMFVLLGRFYKSRFTDEGYLTFTLPATTHQVLLSSFLNCFLGLLFSFAVTVLSFGFLFLFGIEELDGQRLEFIRLCSQYLPKLLDTVGIGNLILFLATALCSIASEIVTIMLAITIGSVVVKNHKLLAAIGFYYLLHTAISILGILALSFTGSTLITALTQKGFEMLFFAMLALGMALLTALYLLMYWLVYKKLNLN